MATQRVYLSSPTMHGDEQRFVKQAFDTNWIAPLGPNVNGFEKEIEEYAGVGHAAALSSGTAAIHLALILLGVGEGDIVFCSDLTFSATVNPVTYVGARQIFIDSERETFNMDPVALKKAFDIYGTPKAVIVANLYGTPAKLDEIKKICDENNTPLIEDAAESLGALYNGKQSGTFGDMGIFSFNGNKIITTSGGGMLVSDNEEYVNQARFLSTQARENERFYEHKVIGYNYRMSNIVAGIGRGQLMHLDEHIAMKKKIYYRYKEAFADIDAIEMNPIPDNCEANYWLSCITIKKECKVKPIDIILALENANIESRHMWKPMHMQPVFADRDFVMADGKVSKGADLYMNDESSDGRCTNVNENSDNRCTNVNESSDSRCIDTSVSADIFSRGLCLPSDIKNTDEVMEEVIGIVRSFFS